jgi:hypothetical protein
LIEKSLKGKKFIHYRIVIVAKLKKKAISAVKKTQILSKMLPANKRLSTMSRTSLWNMGDNGNIYIDQLEAILKPEQPFYPISLQTIWSLHQELSDLNSDDVDLNEYYAFATFMPPGENKIIVSFKGSHAKSAYNFMNFVVPVQKEVNFIFIK